MRSLLKVISILFFAVSPALADSLSGVVVISATAEDNVGVIGVQFQVDGADYGQEIATSPYSITWDTRSVSDGPHTVAVVARDAAGNKGNFLTSITVSNDLANSPPGPLVKSSPLNGSTVQPIGSILTWGNSSDATSFEFCLDTTNNNSCDSSWTSTASTSSALSGLTAGKTYWWQVRARNSSGTTEADSGNWWSFTVPVADRVNVAAAANNAVASASSFVSNGYSPDAATNGDRRGTPWGSGGGWNDGTPDAFPDWLQVDFAGPQRIGEVDVFTVQDSFDKPVEPYLGLTFSQYGVTAFQIQYWDGLSWVIVPGGNITGNNQVWRQIVFAPVTTPRIRVYVTGGLQSSSRIIEVEAYSESGSTNALPGPPVKGIPANASVGRSLNPTLTWGPGSGATGYQYCVDTTNNNACDAGWKDTTTSRAMIEGLKLGTTYFWQVRALNSVGATDADNGAWWSFTTFFGGEVNVAAAINGARASASSSLSTNYAPSSTIDGDRKGTAWGSGGGWNDGTQDSFPDWLQVDFAGPQTISEVDVFTLQDSIANPGEPYPGMTFTQWGITSFQVQYWNGLSWIVLPDGDISSNNAVWRRMTFSPITTQRIRVLVTGALNSWSRITEVEAYTDLSIVPGPLSKISPRNSATVWALATTLSWEASKGASSYEYCVDKSDNNSCDTSWTSTTSTDAPPGTLSVGTYYWQVRARNGTTVTDADNGTWWSFTVGN